MRRALLDLVERRHEAVRYHPFPIGLFRLGKVFLQRLDFPVELRQLALDGFLQDLPLGQDDRLQPRRFLQGKVQACVRPGFRVGRNSGRLVRQDGLTPVLPRNQSRKGLAGQDFLLQFRQGGGQTCPIRRREIGRLQGNPRPGQQLFRRSHANARRRADKGAGQAFNDGVGQGGHEDIRGGAQDIPAVLRWRRHVGRAGLDGAARVYGRTDVFQAILDFAVCRKDDIGVFARQFQHQMIGENLAVPSQQADFHIEDTVQSQLGHVRDPPFFQMLPQKHAEGRRFRRVVRRAVRQPRRRGRAVGIDEELRRVFAAPQAQQEGAGRWHDNAIDLAADDFPLQRLGQGE